MNFVGVTGYTVETSVDPMTGDAILTLKNLTGGATIAEVRAEPYKVKAILYSLSEIARNLYNDQTVDNWTRRSHIDVNEGIATTRLSAPL